MEYHIEANNTDDGTAEVQEKRFLGLRAEAGGRR